MGLAALAKLCKKEVIVSESGLTYYKMEGDRPGYVVGTRVVDRRKQGFLLEVLKKIELDVDHSSSTLVVM